MVEGVTPVGGIIGVGVIVEKKTVGMEGEAVVDDVDIDALLGVVVAIIGGPDHEING